MTSRKLIAAIIVSVLGAGSLIGIGSQVVSSKETEPVQAATTETSRLWAKIVDKGQWDAAGAATYIYYWGGSSSTSWFGVPINWDSTNDLVYYDVPSDTTSVIFVRVNDKRDGVWNQTGDLEATGHFDNWYFNLTGYGGGEWKNDITIKTTKVVSDFVATIDTAAEVCSAENAQAAVDAYNDLATFEQNQFDVLSFGTPAKTGLQTLNYLKSYYSITTPLNLNYLTGNSNSSTPLIITLSSVGITILAVISVYKFKRKTN